MKFMENDIFRRTTALFFAVLFVCFISSSLAFTAFSSYDSIIGGSVETMTHEPISGVIMKAFDGEKTYYGITDHDGVFSISVPTNDNLYTVKPASDVIQGYGALWSAIPDNVGCDSQNNLFVFTEGSTVSGVVRGDGGTAGKPLEGALVVLSDLESGEYLRALHTDSQGRYSFANCGYPVKITVSADGYIEDYEDIFILPQQTSPGQYTADFTLSKSELFSSFNSTDTSITVTPSVVNFGEEATVTVKFHNRTEQFISNASVCIELPEGVSLVGNVNLKNAIAGSETVSQLKLSPSGAIDDSDKGEWSFRIKANALVKGNFIVKAWINQDGKQYHYKSPMVTVRHGYANIPQVIYKSDITEQNELTIYGAVSTNYKYVEAVAVNNEMPIIGVGEIGRNGKFVIRYVIPDDLSTEEKIVIAVRAGVLPSSEKIYLDSSNVSIVGDEVKYLKTSIAENRQGAQNIYDIESNDGVAVINAWTATDMSQNGYIVTTEFDNIPPEFTVLHEVVNGENVVVFETNHDGSNEFTSDITGFKIYSDAKVNVLVKDNANNTVYKKTVANIKFLQNLYGTVMGIDKKPIENAVVTCEVFEGGTWKVWDSAQFGQINPQVTDEDGRFYFSPPIGKYRAKVEKMDYITVYSPENKENEKIILTSTITPAVISVSENINPKDGIYVSFSKAMDPNTLTAATVLLTDGDGKKVTGTVGVLDRGMRVVFKSKEPLKEGNYTITLTDKIKDNINGIHEVTQQNLTTFTRKIAVSENTPGAEYLQTDLEVNFQ